MKKFIDFDYVMGKYDVLSKGFVHLMDEINRVHEMTVVSSEKSMAQSRKSRKDNPTPEASKQRMPIDNNGYLNVKKNYMDDTFTMRINK
jgi:hypothetical protein